MSTDRAVVPAKKKARDVFGFLEKPNTMASLKAVASKMIRPEHLVAVGFSAIAQNRALLTCTKDSMFMAIAKCMATGLEPDGQQAAIVPYGNIATFVPMYQGMIELSHRSGKITDIESNAVFEGDDFAYQYGTKGFLHHIPKGAMCEVERE